VAAATVRNDPQARTSSPGRSSARARALAAGTPGAEHPGVDAARRRQAGGIEAHGQRREHLREFLHGLVGKHADDDADGAGRERAQIVGKHAGRFNIVGDVQHDIAAPLEAARKARAHQPGADRALRHRQHALQAGDRRHRAGGVAKLHRAGQGRRRQLPVLPARATPVPGVGGRAIAELAAELPQLRAGLRRHPGDRLRRIRVRAHRRPAAPQDAGLLAADVLARRAQVLDVVDADPGDDRAIGIHEVHRVQAPAQPDFQHLHRQMRAREQPQRRERAVLEIRERHAAPRRLHGLEAGHQLGVGQRPAVHRHALVVAQQVRRGVAADAMARGGEDLRQQVRGRALAIGAGDGHRGHARGRQAQPGGHRAHPLEAELDRARMQGFLPAQPVFEGGACGWLNRQPWRRARAAPRYWQRPARPRG
jgi:hypothetical protein